MDQKSLARYHNIMVPVAALRIATIVGFFVLSAGCSTEYVVVHRFSQQLACPTSRVAVARHVGKTPPEIASDPERLAIYEHNQPPVWHVSGCDSERFYSCRWSGRRLQNVCSQGSRIPPPPGEQFSFTIPE